MARAIEDNDVVVATCIGTGMDLLATRFRYVVVDECSQARGTLQLISSSGWRFASASDVGLHDSHFLPPHVRAQATETAALCALGRGAD